MYIWRSVLLVEEAGVPGVKNRPSTSNWQTISHKISTGRHSVWRFSIMMSAPSFQGTDHFIFMGFVFLKQNGVVVNFDGKVGVICEATFTFSIDNFSVSYIFAKELLECNHSYIIVKTNLKYRTVGTFHDPIDNRIYTHVRLFTATFVYLQPHLSIYSHVCLFTPTFVYLQPCLSIYSHVFLFTPTFVYLHPRFSIYTHVCLSTPTFVYLQPRLSI